MEVKSEAEKGGTSKSEIEESYLRLLVKLVVPYLQLMRLDRPHGFLYFYFPHLYGAIHAAILLHRPLNDLLRVMGILLVATVFVRGATCSWNDLVDAPIDCRVQRTKRRPMAQGTISKQAASIFILAQSACAAACLLWLPTLCAVSTVPAIFGATIYPWTKRLMDCPQIICALTMAWAVVVGEAATGVAIFRSSGMSQRGEISMIALYAANVSWNFCYETMYSYQDITDDMKTGVRSLAVIFREPKAGKRLLASIASTQIMFLVICGYSMGCSWRSPFNYGSIILTSLTLIVKLRLVRLDEPSSCAWWFARSGMITGSAILSGLAAEYWSRIRPD